MVIKVFGEVLKEARTAKGMSQEALAFASELDRTYISMLERGKRQPTISVIFRLAEALDMSAAEMVGRVEGRVKN